MTEGDSFLPRIQSVFYAVFDVRQGPKIVYQVPEGLIGVPPGSAINGSSSLPSTPSSDTPPLLPIATTGSGLTSRNSSTSLVSPTDYYRPGGRHFTSLQPDSSHSSHRTLFNFNDISMYVIPPPALCGRLVSCSTRWHRIIGFPVELKGKYERNYFRYNLCFVFEREADLSCYEPIVRKVSRVLKACEEESGFLSSHQTSPAVHAILEQLFEDLNSYSETSIPIDQFNSIELKIFPFYPNPPQVKDWMVPLALITLVKRIEENWDLTMMKVVEHINGVNHVSRIARLADCDISLTRLAISHLLYYQVIMTIDIFQYSNMYTLRKSIQWLADEAHVKEECGPYVTKPGRSIPDWPKLLHLYSRLKPGKTIHEWMEAHSIEGLGIDVRRFTSFGVIKGFLRRVHRYPVYLPSQSESPYPSTGSFNPSHSIIARNQTKSLSDTNLQFPVYGTVPEDSSATHTSYRPGQSGLSSVPLEPGVAEPPPSPAPPVIISQSQRARRASAAEKVLEQLRGRDIQKSTTTPALSSPRTSWINGRPNNIQNPTTTTTTTTKAAASATPVSSADAAAAVSSTMQVSLSSQGSPTKGIGARRAGSRRQSLVSPVVPPPSPNIPKHILTTPSRQTRQSLQLPHTNTGHGNQFAIPSALLPLLDGEHHTDELSVRFEAGWPLLEQWLLSIGGGEGNGDYGRVVIIYK